MAYSELLSDVLSRFDVLWQSVTRDDIILFGMIKNKFWTAFNSFPSGNAVVRLAMIILMFKYFIYTIFRGKKMTHK